MIWQLLEVLANPDAYAVTVSPDSREIRIAEIKELEAQGIKTRG